MPEWFILSINYLKIELQIFLGFTQICKGKSVVLFWVNWWQNESFWRTITWTKCINTYLNRFELFNDASFIDTGKYLVQFWLIEERKNQDEEQLTEQNLLIHTYLIQQLFLILTFKSCHKLLQSKDIRKDILLPLNHV